MTKELEPQKMQREDFHPLVLWMEKNQITLAALSKKMGNKPSYIKMILERHKRPGYHLAYRIEALTGLKLDFLLKIPIKKEYNADGKLVLNARGYPIEDSP